MTKEHFEDAPQAEELYEIMESNKEVSSKPVAWLYQVNGNQQYYSDVLPPDDAYDKGTLIPLYTHPVKQLSDEEIELIVKGRFNCHPEESLTSEFAMPLYSVVNLLKQLLRRLQNERASRL